MRALDFTSYPVPFLGITVSDISHDACSRLMSIKAIRSAY